MKGDDLYTRFVRAMKELKVDIGKIYVFRNIKQYGGGKHRMLIPVEEVK